jgi:fatty-acyl-CoA synthase
MQYTSGTTGFPKGVMLTHHNIGNNGYWIAANMNYSPADRICLPVPLFHCFGCVLGVMASLNSGACLVILEKYDPVNVMMAIEKEGCTALYGVPTMFIAILEHPLFNKFDFSTLRTGIMAGSPCPVKSMREVVDRMNMREVTIVFGLTESSPGMTQTRYDEPSLDKKCSTVGRALPGVEVKVFNPETGKECAVGEHGEVCCRGYNVMKGYYNMPEETAKAIDKDGWLHSGDIGVMDADGYLSITGRLKDMIIRGGENVYPRRSRTSSTIWMASRTCRWSGAEQEVRGAGRRVHHPEEGRADDPEDVQDFCRGKIAWYKTPKYIAFVDEYPLTASGKIMKYKLREDAARRWPDA